MLLVALVSLALPFVGIAVLFLSLLDQPFGQVEATMHPRPIVQGRSVRVTGTTDLPEGAMIDYYYWHELDAVNDRHVAHGGHTTAGNGTFEFPSSRTPSAEPTD